MDQLTDFSAGSRPTRLTARALTRVTLATATSVTVAAAGGAADAASAWTCSLAAGSTGQARAGTLTAPTGVGAICSSNKVPVIVYWTASANAASYAVLQATSPSGPYTQVDSGVTGSNDAITPGNAGTYYWKVVANRSNWSSSPSAATPVARTTQSNGNCS
jgi:hypothetical protein